MILHNQKLLYVITLLFALTTVHCNNDLYNVLKKNLKLNLIKFWQQIPRELQKRGFNYAPKI